MNATRFIDTNILLYSISREPAEQNKRGRALLLLDERHNAFSVQVLQEFYVQATRATRKHPLAHEAAVGLMRAWLRFPVQDLTLAVMNSALEIKATAMVSYWDAAIVAAARALGCSEILTEDLQHGEKIAGVRVTNPFL